MSHAMQIRHSFVALNTGSLEHQKKIRQQLTAQLQEYENKQKQMNYRVLELGVHATIRLDYAQQLLSQVQQSHNNSAIEVSKQDKEEHQKQKNEKLIELNVGISIRLNFVQALLLQVQKLQQDLSEHRTMQSYSRK